MELSCFDWQESSLISLCKIDNARKSVRYIGFFLLEADIVEKVAGLAALLADSTQLALTSIGQKNQPK